jgi:hypothetical protein
MPIDLSGLLVIGISSRVLFDLEWENMLRSAGTSERTLFGPYWYVRCIRVTN